MGKGRVSLSHRSSGARKGEGNSEKGQESQVRTRQLGVGQAWETGNCSGDASRVNDAGLKVKRRLEADARGVAQCRGLGRTWVRADLAWGVSLVEYPGHS